VCDDDDDDDDDDEGLTHGVAVHGPPSRVCCVMLVILGAQFSWRHRLGTDHSHFTSHETRLDTHTHTHKTRARRYTR